MSKITLVIEFKEGSEPKFDAGMEVLGGKVIAVQFDDALERLTECEERLQFVGDMQLERDLRNDT